MGLESLTGGSVFIDDLVNTNPATGDQKSEGDDHLRGIKNVLLNSFPGITGAVTSTHTELNGLDGLTASRAIVTNGSGIVSAATTTSTEIGYVNGVTSAIQTQLDGKLSSSAGQVTTTNIEVSVWGGEYIKLSDAKTSGTDGGTFTSGAWQTRTLTTENSDTGSNCTLSSNQFTLDAGTYEIHATVPGYRVDGHKSRLYNISDTAIEIVGSAMRSSGTGGTTTSIISGKFTIASSKTFEIQHRCETTQATDGFGYAVGFTSEVYTIVVLRKVA